MTNVAASTGPFAVFLNDCRTLLDMIRSKQGQIARILAPKVAEGKRGEFTQALHAVVSGLEKLKPKSGAVREAQIVEFMHANELSPELFSGDDAKPFASDDTALKTWKEIFSIDSRSHQVKSYKFSLLNCILNALMQRNQRLAQPDFSEFDSDPVFSNFVRGSYDGQSFDDESPFDGKLMQVCGQDFTSGKEFQAELAKFDIEYQAGVYESDESSEALYYDDLSVNLGEMVKNPMGFWVLLCHVVSLVRGYRENDRAIGSLIAFMNNCVKEDFLF